MEYITIPGFFVLLALLAPLGLAALKDYNERR